MSHDPPPSESAPQSEGSRRSDGGVPSEPADTREFRAPKETKANATPSPVDETTSLEPIQDELSGDSTSIRTTEPLPVIGEPTVISQRPPIHAPAPTGGFDSRELGKTLAGRSLAHFDLLEFVGGGGMGAVFRATDTMLDRTVAVKVLSRAQGRDEETVKRFRNEAQSAARLDHDNIARVYYVGEDDGWYFIVFEFIHGRNLRELVLERGPLPVEHALQVTLQVAEALEHASSRDVVHRDIKPSNVLLMPNGRAKLVDMGLARFNPLNPSDDDLTASGVTLGTFDYISPEQARDPRLADARSDIYSLGCTLFFMLTGQPPFPDGTVLQKLLNHSSEAPPDPRKWRSDLPAALGPIMSRMLAKQPVDRYQNPYELVDDLRRLADQLGIGSKRSAPMLPLEHRPRRRTLRDHLPWIVPVVVMIAVGQIWQPAWLVGNRTDAAIEPTFVSPEPDSTQDLSNDTTTPKLPLPVAADPSNGANLSAAPSLTPSASESDGTSSTIDNGELRGASDGDERLTLGNESITTSNRRLVVGAPRPFAINAEPPLTLKAACARAIADPDVNTIEIQRSGTVELTPIDIDLNGQELSIVAGQGYKPTLTFRSPTSVTDDSYPGMIRVSNGQLNLTGVRFELNVPSESLEGEWALFQLESMRGMRLSRCSVAIRNSYSGRYSNLDNVSVFRLEVGSTSRVNDLRLPTQIALTDCKIKCESSVVYAQRAIALEFSWDNGLLVSSERLATIGGQSELPGDNELMEFDLHRVTASVDQGLAEFTASLSRPYLVPVTVRSRHCIWMTQNQYALINQSGRRNLAEFMEQIAFAGEHNAYLGMETMWRVQPGNRRMTEIDFDQWRNRWRLSQAIHQDLPWRYTIDPNRPVHETSVVDFELERNSTTLSLGFDALRLPD